MRGRPAGLDGRIHSLDIESNEPTVVLEVPGRAPIIEMQASHDFRLLATLSRPKMFDRNPAPPLLQVWDTELLLRR